MQKKHGDMKGNIIDEYLQMMRMMTLEHLWNLLKLI